MKATRAGGPVGRAQGRAVYFNTRWADVTSDPGCVCDSICVVSAKDIWRNGVLRIGKR